MNMSHLRITAACLLLGALLVAGGFVAADGSPAPLEQQVAIQSDDASMEEQSELLSDWEFTRGRRSGRCRFVGTGSRFVGN